MDFTFKAYSNALKIAQINFVDIMGFEDFINLPSHEKTTRSVLLLRHDCERDLEKAVEMATIEYDYDIKTSYFIRAHSEYYNLNQIKERNYIREIEKMGHEIGLHYEPQFYNDDGKNLTEGIEIDIQVLKSILKSKNAVRILSPHQPTLTNPDFNKIAHEKYIDAYTHVDIRPLSYYSDSGMVWRDKTLEQVALTETRCQFLIHPDFWNHDEIDWFNNLSNRVEKVKNDLDSIVEREKLTLKNYLINRETHDRKFTKILEDI